MNSNSRQFVIIIKQNIMLNIIIKQNIIKLSIFRIKQSTFSKR